ncbi:hypothetical protein Hanom_Chr08g00713871 [Helianthus anomalus]
MLKRNCNYIIITSNATIIYPFLYISNINLQHDILVYVHINQPQDGNSQRLQFH